jgi:hypothetical protein
MPQSRKTDRCPKATAVSVPFTQEAQELYALLHDGVLKPGNPDVPNRSPALEVLAHVVALSRWKMQAGPRSVPNSSGTPNAIAAYKTTAASIERKQQIADMAWRNWIHSGDLPNANMGYAESGSRERWGMIDAAQAVATAIARRDGEQRLDKKANAEVRNIEKRFYISHEAACKAREDALGLLRDHPKQRDSTPTPATKLLDMTTPKELDVMKSLENAFLSLLPGQKQASTYRFIKKIWPKITGREKSLGAIKIALLRK